MAITRNLASKCKDHLEALPMVSLDETSEKELIAAENEEKDVRGVPLSEVVRMIDRLPNGYGLVFLLRIYLFRLLMDHLSTRRRPSHPQSFPSQEFRHQEDR